MKNLNSLRGISLLEVLITVGAIGILAGLGAALLGNSTLSGSKNARLRHDVAALNSAVTAYKYSGGDLSGIDDPRRVIEKLKSRSLDSDVSLTAGFSGSFLDSDIVPVLQSESEGATHSLRAVWNSSSQRFELKQSGAPGLISLRRSEIGQGNEPGTEERKRLVSYASEGTWIWDYADSSAPAPIGPSSVPLSEIPPTTSPLANPVPPPPPPPLNKQILQAPQISVPGGTFSVPSFPLSVSLIDPNPPGTAILAYSINYEDWINYTGAAISMPPASVLRAQALPVNSSEWEPSFIVSEAYLLRPLTLSPPDIYFSSEFFSSDKTNPVTTIQVTLTDTNEPGLSGIQYQIVPVPGGTGVTTNFAAYSGSFEVLQVDYPLGFGIRTFAEGIAVGYQDSVTVSRFASDFEGLFAGHLDLDTSDFITEIGNGDTEAHTHDITGKYNATSINFFQIPDSSHITIPEAIPDPSRPFKLTVVNGDLSPGMSLKLKYFENGESKTLYSKVNTYDDTKLEELITFSLDGSGTTARLESATIVMDRDIILQAGVIPSNTGDVSGNVPGKENEWRNGAITVQAVAVASNGDDDFTVDTSLSSGGHGAAVSGLLWEGALFWHWDGDSYHEEGNRYDPNDLSSIEEHIDDLYK